MVFSDGHIAISQQGEVGLWRGGRLVDRLDLRNGPGDQFDGADHRGTSVIAGVRSNEDDLRVNLLDVSGDEIVRRMTVEPDYWIFRGQPLDDGRLMLLDVDGVAHIYGNDGELLEEHDVGFDPTIGFLASGFDGQGRIALARESTVGGSSQVDVIDPVSGDRYAFLTLGQVRGLGFADDGRLLLIQGADGSIRLHDLPSGATSPLVWDGAEAPFGKAWHDEATDTVWMATTDRLVQLPLDRDGWREQACRRVGRDLSAEEWERFVPGDGPKVSACPAATT
jgi:WD40 repeat protein